MFGQERGRQAANDSFTREEKNKLRGIPRNFPSVTMNSINVAGLEVGTGDNLSTIGYANNTANRWSPNNRWISLFCTIKTSTVTQFGGQAFFGCKGNFGSQKGYALVNGGNSAPGHPFFSFEVSNGASTTIAVSAETPVTGRYYRLFGRYDRTTATGELWIDGHLSGTSAASSVDPTPNTSDNVNLFEYQAQAAAPDDEQTTVGMIWDRWVTNAEIQLLYRDPYAGWRAPTRSSSLGGLEAAGIKTGSFFMSF